MGQWARAMTTVDPVSEDTMTGPRTAPEILDDALTVSEAARICGVSPTTIRRANRLGMITSWRTAGGHRRFSRARCLEFRRSLGHQGPLVQP